MIKILLLITALFFTSCVNRHGISVKYYSDCKEYYDLQGYYHNECGEDDILTYKEISEEATKAKNYFTGKKELEKGNVW